MINKQSLWFLTLFSLILVLSIYYLTMPNDLLVSNNSKIKTVKTEKTNGEIEDAKTTIKESELLVTMRVNLESEREEKIKDLKSTLTNENISSEEKNSAYEQIKYITNLTSEENALEKKLKKEFGLDSFINIDNKNVKVVVVKKDHDVTLANNIMKAIQSEFESKMSITVQFET